jgi:hypothetical protein
MYSIGALAYVYGCAGDSERPSYHGLFGRSRGVIDLFKVGARTLGIT